ncbi:MAG: hypothetical protein CVU51_07465 [Deltaproteobacteria bacterium HGW-Deltaproteobacteria-1]|nr:MAG: hypothetical protein CVU51_07465 [Deltaproteobacteria bacterium HGW-Deltaproteobacteria-1]
MRHRVRKIFIVIMGFIIWGMLFCCLNGCDSGDKVIDEATGNRALKQYNVAKDKLKTIEEKQKEKYKDIGQDETQESKQDK